MHRPPASVNVAVLALALVTTALPIAAVPTVGASEGPGFVGEAPHRPADHRLPDGPSALDPCIPHPQIEITEDEGPQGFILDREPVTGRPIYRPGSGVVDGDGTAEDPYVIEGWCIPLQAPGLEDDPFIPTLQGAGIHVADTTAHVVIRDTTLEGRDDQLLTAGQQVGIRLDGADNVAIRDNTIRDHEEGGVRISGTNQAVLAGNTILGNGDEGIEIDHGGEVTFVDNTIIENGLTAVDLTGATRTTLKDNTINGNGQDAIDLGSAGIVTVTDNVLEDNVDVGVDVGYTSTQAVVSNNTITGNNRAIDLHVQGQATVEDNTVTDSTYDALDLDAADATVAGNTVTGNGGTGIRLDADTLAVRNNTVEDNTGDGVDLEFPDLARLENNTVASNGNAGVRIVDPGEVTLTHNDILGNDDREEIIDDDDDGGIHVDAGQTVDARNNWWGAASGPSGAIEDACTGEPADGAGELITVASGGEVCFDPWLEGSVETAGAGS